MPRARHQQHYVYAWKSKFGGMEASDIKRMRDLEQENARLKQMYAYLNLEKWALKDVIEKSSEASRASVRLEAQTAVNACWSVDFMRDALLHGQRFRTFNVLDDFSREVLAVEVDTNLPAARVTRVLDRIVAWRCYPAKMRMDNGPEFVSVQLAEWAEQHGVDLEFIQPDKPTQNAYSEVRHIVDTWVQEYNEQRPHESLGNLTPEEFALKHAGDSSLALH